MTTFYKLYEVTFANGASICIKSLSTIKIPEHVEKLDIFLADDIAKNGQYIDINPINYEEAETFFDFSNFDNWPVFDYDSKLQDPWFVYEIGDLYRNNNGENYIIIAMDQDKDKMILAKKSMLGDKKITLYIGAKGIYMHSWSFGHYFMQNFEAACNWFNEEDEDDNHLLVKDFMEMYMGPENSTIFICNSSVFNYYAFYDNGIPDVLKNCKVHNIGVKFFYVGDGLTEEDIFGITLYIDFYANEVDTAKFAQDYGSYEL